MQLKTDMLAAAAEVASKQDVRYYLNGVRVERFADNTIKYTATDGTMLFTCWDDTQVGVDVEPLAFTVPRQDAVEAGKAKTVNLDLEDAASRESDPKENDQPLRAFILGNKRIVEQGGVYPDIARVIPSTTSGEHAAYNPFKVVTLARAFNRLRGRGVNNDAGEQPVILPNGAGSGLVLVESVLNAAAVIMPCRTGLALGDNAVQENHLELTLTKARINDPHAQSTQADAA